MIYTPFQSTYILHSTYINKELNNISNIETGENKIKSSGTVENAGGVMHGWGMNVTGIHYMEIII